MTDSSLSTIPHFTLGQELTLPIFDDHSDDTEEEPLTKRIRMGTDDIIPTTSLDSNPNTNSNTHNFHPSNCEINSTCDKINPDQNQNTTGSGIGVGNNDLSVPFELSEDSVSTTTALHDATGSTLSSQSLPLNAKAKTQSHDPTPNNNLKPPLKRVKKSTEKTKENDVKIKVQDKNAGGKTKNVSDSASSVSATKKGLSLDKNSSTNANTNSDTNTNMSSPPSSNKGKRKRTKGKPSKISKKNKNTEDKDSEADDEKKHSDDDDNDHEDQNDDGKDDDNENDKTSSSSSEFESESEDVSANASANSKAKSKSKGKGRSKSKSGSSPSSKPKSKSSKKRSRPSHMRKNIRDILSTNQLEEETIAAQREEQERIKRMNLKLQMQQQQQQQREKEMKEKQQQQQQNHLVQLLNSTSSPSGHHFNHQSFSLGQEEIDKMFLRKGITSTSAVDPSIVDPAGLAASELPSAATPSDSASVTAPDLIPIAKFGLGHGLGSSASQIFARQQGRLLTKKPNSLSTIPTVIDDVVILSSDDDDEQEAQEVITLDDQDHDFDFPTTIPNSLMRSHQQPRYPQNSHPIGRASLKDFMSDTWNSRNGGGGHRLGHGLDSFLNMSSFRNSGGTLSTSDSYCKTLTKLLKHNSGELDDDDRDLDHDERPRSGGVIVQNKLRQPMDPTEKMGDGGAGSDSSDDCVVISPPSFHEEIEKEGKEDENNVPDELGRVLINVGHPAEDPDIFLAPQIARAVKPHQIGGIRFMYDNIVESLEDFEKANGFGCILAHSMGLGKTIQAVSFCDIFLRYTSAKTVLIIVPINTIQNWVNEFNFWIPPQDPADVSSSTGAPKKSFNKGQPNGNGKKPKTSRKQCLKNSRINPEDQDTPSPSQSQSLDQLLNQSISALASTLASSATAQSNLSSSHSSPMNLEAQEELSSNSNLEAKDDNSNSNSNSNNSKESGGASIPNPNSSPPADVTPRNFQVFVLNETVKTLAAREKIIADWNSKGGVLLLGYEMYRMLALKRLKRSSKKKLASLAMRDDQAYAAAEEESSLEMIYSHIVKPGPDLVICDEGHRIKNSGASISQALKDIRTKRRIVLTGYPLQNNLMEYWCMVDFVRPNYLGSKAEFSNMFERPITNGQCVDSSFADKQIMRYRSHVLHTLLEGFVQRRSHLVLQSALPFKEEWVFLLKMTPIQYSLYKEFIRYLKEERQDKSSGVDKDGAPAPTTNPIKAFAVCCKIWNHPDALYNVVKKHKDILDDLDLDDIGGADDGAGSKKSCNGGGGRKPRKNGRNNNKISLSRQNQSQSQSVTFAPPLSATNSSVHSDFGLNFSADYFGGFGVAASLANIPTTVNTPQNFVTSSNTNTNPTDGRSISLDWATPIFKNYEAELLENGVKFQLLFVILEEVEKIGDKLLVFSQSLLTLDLIELFLAKKFNWKKNQQYFRLDGGTSGLEREKLICDFNAKEGVHLFLVSTRAGSLGINLIGANRVVVFDASWNPCHDAQAVCRVYRYGQKKECQIYRFVTDCSLEKRIYDRQINKRGIADRVVDEMNPEAHLNTKDVSSFLVLDHAQMDALQEANHSFNMTKFTDPVLKNVLDRCGDRLTKEPFEHESLLIDRKETKLSAKEKRQARRNYEMEKKQIEQPGSGFSNNSNMSGSGGNYSYSRPSYAAFYPKNEGSGSPSSSSFGGLPYSPNSQSDFYGNYPSSSSTSNSSSYDSRNNPSTIPVPPSFFNNTASSLYSSGSGSSSRRKLSLHEQIKELSQFPARRLEVRERDVPYEALKQKGVDCRFMMLKKDAYMQDPAGGPEMYLRAGEKINIFRSHTGIYVRVANGRIIAVKPTSANSSLLQGIPLTGEVSTEKLQNLVYSLLRPAGKGPPPYYSPYVNPKLSSSSGANVDSSIHGQNHSHSHGHGHGHGHGLGHSHGHQGSSSFNKTLPSLQKLPPTAGLIPSPYHHNHQITNFRSNSGGDVTILRKMAGRNGSSSNMHSALESLNTLPPSYGSSGILRKFGSVISQGSSANAGTGAGSGTGTTAGSGSGTGNSNHSDNSQDVEIIEFDTHFGEILNPSRAVEDNMKKLQVSPRLSSSSQSQNQGVSLGQLSGSNTNSMSSGSMSPDMSITPIPQVAPSLSSLSSSLNQSTGIPLTLDSLLGADAAIGGGTGISRDRRNFSSLRGASGLGHGAWDPNQISGAGTRIESPVSSTTPAEGNLESLFWNLTDGPVSGSGMPLTAPSSTSNIVSGNEVTSGTGASRLNNYDPSFALQNLLQNFSPGGNHNNSSKGGSSRAHQNSASRSHFSALRDRHLQLPGENFRFLPNSDVNQFSHFFDQVAAAEHGSRSGSASGSGMDTAVDMCTGMGLDLTASNSNEVDKRDNAEITEVDGGGIELGIGMEDDGIDNDDDDDEIQVPLQLNDVFLSDRSRSGMESRSNPNQRNITQDTNRNLVRSPGHGQYYSSDSNVIGNGSGNDNGNEDSSANNIESESADPLDSSAITNTLKQIHNNNSTHSTNNFSTLFGFSNC